MSDVTEPPTTAATDGEVVSGFEPVKEVFQAGLDGLGDGGGAFAAYLDGKSIVDVWGGMARPGQHWREDTVTVLFSATKGLAAMAMQVLADRKLIDVEEPVVTYWPEFGQAGKQDITVHQVLNHTAGVLSFPGYEELLTDDGGGYDDYDAIAAGLAAASPAWTPGSQHGYHMKTFGWLVGELVRRVSGQTIGDFVHEAICDPLGLEISIGTTSDRLPRVARVIDALADVPEELRGLQALVGAALDDPKTLLGQANLATGRDRQRWTLVNSPRFLAAEFASGGATGDARSLARLFAMFAADGVLDGVRVLAPGSAGAWSQEDVCAPDVLFEELGIPAIAPPVRRSLGYLLYDVPCDSRAASARADVVGVMGLGGQLAFCDPKRRLAVGFVRSELTQRTQFSDELIRSLYSCLDS